MQGITPLLALLAVVGGCVLFEVKYKVVDIEQQLSQTLALIEQEKENLHMLRAEWSHLNDPKRLQALAQQLGIYPVQTTQIIALGRHRETSSISSGTRPKLELASMREAP